MIHNVKAFPFEFLTNSVDNTAYLNYLAKFIKTAHKLHQSAHKRSGEVFLVFHSRSIPKRNIQIFSQ